MANKTVADAIPGYTPCLAPDEIGRVVHLCAQAQAIAHCIGAASTSGDELPDGTIINAASAISDLIDRIVEAAISPSEAESQATRKCSAPTG